MLQRAGADPHTVTAVREQELRQRIRDLNGECWDAWSEVSHLENKLDAAAASAPRRADRGADKTAKQRQKWKRQKKNQRARLKVVHGGADSKADARGAA